MYATLAIAYIEEKLFEKVNIEFGEEFRSYLKNTGKGSWTIVSSHAQGQKPT